MKSVEFILKTKNLKSKKNIEKLLELAEAEIAEIMSRQNITRKEAGIIAAALQKQFYDANKGKI